MLFDCKLNTLIFKDAKIPLINQNNLVTMQHNEINAPTSKNKHCEENNRNNSKSTTQFYPDIEN